MKLNLRGNMMVGRLPDSLTYIELLQCLILNELELLVEHGVFHKSGHVFESFSETVIGIPGWGKNRLKSYVSRLRELITHRREDRLPSATFSWLVSELTDFIHKLALGTYKLRECFKDHCDSDILYYFCDDKFIKNLEPNLFLNSFTLKKLDEALIWILHSDESAGDEKKMKQQKKGEDIIKWDYKDILSDTGIDEFVYGPYTNIKRRSNRRRHYFPIYYNGEPIISDGVSEMLTFTSSDEDEYGDENKESTDDEVEAESGVNAQRKKKKFKKSKKYDSPATTDDDNFNTSSDEDEEDKKQRRRRQRKQQKKRSKKVSKKKNDDDEKSDDQNLTDTDDEDVKVSKARRKKRKEQKRKMKKRKDLY